MSAVRRAFVPVVITVISMGCGKTGASPDASPSESCPLATSTALPSAWTVGEVIGDGGPLFRDQDGFLVEYIGGAPSVAVDPCGNALAAWAQAGESFTLWTAPFRPQTGWGRPERIDDGSDVLDGASPTVVMAPDGGALFVWGSSAAWGRPAWLWARYRRPNGSWEAPTLLNGPPGGVHEHVSVDGRGRFLVVWVPRIVNGSVGLQAAHFSVAEGWTRTQAVSEGYSYDMDLVVDAAGDAILVWSTQEGTSILSTRRFDAATATWGPIQRLDVGAYDARVAGDVNGNAIVVWRESVRPEAGRSGRTIWSSRFTLGQGWTAPQPVAGEDASDLAAAIDQNQNALVGWRSFLSTGGQAVRVARSSSAGDWAPTNAVMSGSSSVESLQIAVDAAGRAVATWEQDVRRIWDGASYQYNGAAWANQYTPEGGWGVPVRLPSPPGRRNYRPAALALAPGGSGVAVWAESDGARSSIIASRLGPP